MANFNTANPESIEYANDILKQTILGGIKLEGLDRMRVTLKIELIGSSRPAVRHNLDLYNDNQLEKLIRKVAERMEIGTSVDRKSTRLNSSHVRISYAVFCLKKKKRK